MGKWLKTLDEHCSTYYIIDITEGEWKYMIIVAKTVGIHGEVKKYIKFAQNANQKILMLTMI